MNDEIDKNYILEKELEETREVLRLTQCRLEKCQERLCVTQDQWEESQRRMQTIEAELRDQTHKLGKLQQDTVPSTYFYVKELTC